VEFSFMHAAALILSAALVTASAPAEMPAPPAGDRAEVYVAELDREWNVAREVRVVCDARSACAADLDGGVKVHVRFDPLGGGAVAVSSRIEDGTGQTKQAPDVTLSLDRKGFGATHFETASLGEGSRILMMAVQAPGLASSEPTRPAPPAAGQPI
jgi:hypothetical protein